MLPKEVCNQTPLDEEVRYDCPECGDTKGHLYVVRTPVGWRGYCHKCGYSGTRRAGVRSILESRQEHHGGRLLDNDRRHSGQIDDVEEDFELPRREAFGRVQIQWLRKYITDQEINLFRIYQSQGKIVLPIYEREILIGYQTRLFGKGPKYLTFRRPDPTGGHRQLIFKVRGRGRTPESGTPPECPIDGSGGAIVPNPVHGVCTNLYIVEDILSAIRLSRILWDCDVWAILGSPERLGNGIMDNLRTWKESQTRSCEVVIWYDFDKRAAALKVSKRLRQILGVKSRCLFTLKDPKELSDIEIFQKIDIDGF